MMGEKRYYVNCAGYLCDNDLSNTLSIFECADLLNQLTKENEQLRSLNNACEYGQKSLMEEMKNNDEALDKIWEIMKELYGGVEDE